MDTKVKIVSLLVIALIILAIILIAISLDKLNSDEVGLKYDPFSKSLGKKPTYEGLHYGPPGFSFVVFPGVFHTLDFYSLKCLNKDGVEIRLTISYQYRVKPDELFRLVKQFRDHRKFLLILNSIGESAIHDACSKFNTSQFQAERGAFQEEVRKLLVAKYNAVATEITDLQVNDIRRPSKYENAVKKKEGAREDIEVARNERPQRLTEAGTKKLEAETEADIKIDRANSQAKIAETKANSEAEGVLNEYHKEAETFVKLKNDLRMNTEAFLSYLAVRVIAEAESNVYIGLKPPAKTDYGVVRK